MLLGLFRFKGGFQRHLIMWDKRMVEKVSAWGFFFFLLSNFKFNKKAQRGATLIYGKYTRVPLNGRNS